MYEVLRARHIRSEQETRQDKIHTNQDNWKERSWARLKGTLYPFKESTLIMLKERCNELRDNLTLAVTTLQVYASFVPLLLF